MKDLRERIVIAVVSCLQDGDDVVEIQVGKGRLVIVWPKPDDPRTSEDYW